jgi:hypothetical protein
MSGMHMLPIYFTTTNQKKRKNQKKTSKLLIAEAEHEKFLKKMGYKPKGEKCYGSTSDSKPLSRGSTPCSPAKIPSVGDGIGNAYRKERPEYNGNVVIGQAYNKGGLQVLSTREANDPMTGKRR